MDNFYPVLIKNDGTIIHNVFATSHKDLICKYITADEKPSFYFKATYSPKEGCRLDDLDSYKLIINESYIPEWFTDYVQNVVVSQLRKIIESMIVRNRRQLLLNEGAILVGNANIDEIKNSVVFAMYDNAKINILDYGTIIDKITDECVVEDMRDNTRINELYGYAKVLEMDDYSKIMKMYGQAKVGVMHGNSRIAMLKGDANIIEMQDMSQADRLKHMSKVDEMHGHAVIEEMWDWTIVERMFDQSRINYMDEDSKVCEMYGDSTIEMMCGNAIVEKLYENSLVRKLKDAAQIFEKEL